MTPNRRHFHHTALAAATALLLLSAGSPSLAASADDLDKDSAQALQTLYKNNATAQGLSKSAKAWTREEVARMLPTPNCRNVSSTSRRTTALSIITTILMLA